MYIGYIYVLIGKTVNSVTAPATVKGDKIQCHYCIMGRRILYDPKVRRPAYIVDMVFSGGINTVLITNMCLKSLKKIEGFIYLEINKYRHNSYVFKYYSIGD